MFTGLIEEVGSITAIQQGHDKYTFKIKGNKVLEGTKIGDSISTNGICLTVVKLEAGFFYADVMPETLKRSTLSTSKVNTIVNLERALQIGDRLGGHLVSGHIDGTGTVTNITQDKNAIWVTIEAGAEVLRYIIEKGSVALDGISLTVAAVSMSDFKVSIIPHTAAQTTLKERQVGDSINIECDLFGKYIHRFQLFKELDVVEEQRNKAPIDMDFLRKNGFA